MTESLEHTVELKPYRRRPELPGESSRLDAAQITRVEPHGADVRLHFAEGYRDVPTYWFEQANQPGRRDAPLVGSYFATRPGEPDGPCSCFNRVDFETAFIPVDPDPVSKSTCTLIPYRRAGDPPGSAVRVSALRITGIDHRDYGRIYRLFFEQGYWDVPIEAFAAKSPRVGVYFAVFAGSNEEYCISEENFLELYTPVSSDTEVSS